MGRPAGRADAKSWASLAADAADRSRAKPAARAMNRGLNSGRAEPIPAGCRLRRDSVSENHGDGSGPRATAGTVFSSAASGPLWGETSC